MADTSKNTPMTAEIFLQQVSQKIRDQSGRLDDTLVRSSVLLRKRTRGLNDDDLTGAFAPVTNNWVSIDNSSIYSFNIVKPTIRANTAALITARIKLMAEPVSIRNPRAEMASQVAGVLLEEYSRSEWTNQLFEYIANEIQTAPGVFLKTEINPHKKRYHSVPKFETVSQIMPGMAICSECGSETLVETEVEPDSFIPCEVCGGAAIVERMPEIVDVDVKTGFDEFSTGTPETKAYPFWEFRIDQIGTQGGNIENARWFEHHYLTSADELILEYPESADEIRGAVNTDWSYGLRWQYSLQTGGRGLEDLPEMQVYPLCEVRDIFLTPSMYLNTPLAEDFVLKNSEGKVRFKVKQGKTFADGEFEGEPLEEFVLCFRMAGNSILDVFPMDFTKAFAYIGFLHSSAQFWALFATELITLQDIVNYMLTIQMYHVRRNATTSIIYNSNAIDPEAFGKDLIGSKNTLPYDHPISNTYGVIPALELREPMQMVQATMAVRGDITQVQPAMVGEAQPNQPYAAQLLQKQQSLGLLSPASLSVAHGKVKSAKEYVRLRKSLWTEEDTAALLDSHSDWTEEFIDAFLETDIDHEIIISFAQGSEIPQTLMEREIKLRQTLQDIGALMQFNPAMVREETLIEILHEIMQAGNVEIDVNNTESDLRLAESRYDFLLTLLERQPFEATDDPMWNQGIAEQILKQHPIFQPMMIEGHKTIIEFYSEKARQALASDDPNFLVATCLQGMIALQQQAEVMLAQRMGQMQMAAQAPMMQMQQEQMMQQQAAASEEAAAAQQQAQAEKEADRAYDREVKTLEMLDKEEDRKLKRDEMKQKQKAAKG
ncbi:hypothetical protein [Geitlerinema calcuttense]|uniref:Uncharacterized protein n=1 Tax=Geitlerinema calcuttense NRMC-F 0142 TaxID=2922238 RepID=A0ABT7LV40_9CYAN|nr:hypothetical protein [Geitlerinema calcuttense]MDL5055901.1 hypothetical protein [Geitlerinema calcuttense NRMC-F 0142]